jgi:hypothetical protein
MFRNLGLSCQSPSIYPRVTTAGIYNLDIFEAFNCICLSKLTDHWLHGQYTVQEDRDLGRIFDATPLPFQIGRHQLFYCPLWTVSKGQSVFRVLDGSLPRGGGMIWCRLDRFVSSEVLHLYFQKSVLFSVRFKSSASS